MRNSRWMPCGAEALERRALLSAAAYSALKYTGNLVSGPLHKIGPSLADVYVQYKGYKAPGGHHGGQTFRASGDGVESIGTRLVLSGYTAKGQSTATLAAAIRKLGGVITARAGNEVDFELTPGELGQLAALKALQFAQPVQALSMAGSVTSQGDVAERSDIARAADGLSGSGVKVGILSDSFNALGGYSADVASGDLPANVQILEDDPSGTDEGRAMAQIVHDVAPSASVAFATAYYGEADFANNIKALAAAGCKVICDDVYYLNEPAFQDGPIAQAIDYVEQHGVTYFSAAGNFARDAYAGNFVSGTTYGAGAFTSSGGPAFRGGIADDFGNGITMLPFTLAQNASLNVDLQWDQPNYSVSGGSGCRGTVDVYVLDSSNHVVAGSASAALGGDADDDFTYSNSGSSVSFKLMVVSSSGVLPTYFRLVDTDGQATGLYNGGATVIPHAGASGAIAVGAAGYGNTPPFNATDQANNTAEIESFSSAGPSEIFFDTSGNRYATPVIRQKPQIVAPDGVSTSGFSSEPYLATFYGTSAATPHAAAVAALLLGAVPTATPTQIAAVLESTALDMDDPSTSGFDVGYDSGTGYGFIQADAAAKALLAETTGSISGVTFQDNNGDGTQDNGEPVIGGVTVYLDLNHDGVLDAGDVSTTSDATSGAFSFSNLEPGNYAVQEVAPSGYVISPASSGTATQVVSAGATDAGVQLGSFPTVFAGTSGNDTMVLRLDASGTNVQIFQNAPLSGSPTYAIARSALTTLSFTPGSGDDSLTVDWSNGNPLPVGGVSFDGGSGNNSLMISGPAAGSVYGIGASSVSVNGATVQFANMTSLTLSAGNGNDTFNVVGSGVNPLIQPGAGNDALNLSAPLTLNGDLGATDAMSIAVNSGGSLTMNATQHLAGLTLNGTAAATLNANGTVQTVIVTGGLAIDYSHGAKLDLKTNALILAYSGTSPLAAVNSALAAGFNGGDWNASSGLTSSSVSSAQPITGLGAIDNAALIQTVGSGFSSFAGQAVSANDILIKYTYDGDANLDGTVNGTDFQLTELGYLGSKAPGWMTGDFDYSGAVNGVDFQYIDLGQLFQAAPL